MPRAAIKKGRMLQEKTPQPANKCRRITRSEAAREIAIERGAVFEKVVWPLLGSGLLRWHEAENLGLVNKGCQAVWKDQRDTYSDWALLLKELNSMNCTNRCVHCELAVHLKANRKCCSVEKWNIESAKRTADFHGVVDILMSSGVLTWREKGSIRRISKPCYKIHKEHCTCRKTDRAKRLKPFVSLDPRYKEKYDELENYQKCRELVKYQKWMVKNLHSFYNLTDVTDPDRLPDGLVGWPWFDIQLLSLQRTCPRRYAFVMNIVTLYIAQTELQRSPPNWYYTAFLGEEHAPVQGPSFEECLGAGISEYCLPATDKIFINFLRRKCYPCKTTQRILGPLVHDLSIFSPLFSMVPLDAHASPRLPGTLEKLSNEMIDNMSLQFFCTIS